MVNVPTAGTKPAMATRMVLTRTERLGGADARGGPFGNEESRGRLGGAAETGATVAGEDEAATAELLGSDEGGAEGGADDGRAAAVRDNIGTGGRDDLRADGGSDLRGGGGTTDDGRAGGGNDDKVERIGAGHGGSFVGGGRTEPRSRTPDGGGDDGGEASRAAIGALRLVNSRVA
jgi:hypothetical protein